jgi:hypothetical protein
MRSRRPKTAAFLFLCGVTLLVSIFAGEKMGERVLRKTTQTAILVPQVETPSPAPSATEAGPIRDWRKLRVVTVATDPGFPDPRVTKPPTPTPKPTPTPTPIPTPSPAPTATPGQAPSPTPSGLPGGVPIPSLYPTAPPPGA